VAYFVEPVWSRHDRERIEVYAYFNNVNGDAITQRLRGYVDGWLECGEMSDAALAQRIYEDAVDILVDLSGHTGGNRLQVFARKPAPVQVSWLGYPTTTGVSAIDYRISDWEVDPAGYEGHSVERLVRMSSSYYCYRAGAQAPELAALPARRTGHVTFGSFNNLAKVSGALLQLWGRILQALPQSRLLLKSKTLLDHGVRRRVLERMSEAGIDVERVRLHGWSRESGEHLSLYGEVDIGLDTYPYNGATTTCEALWMGVPVITLKGASHASRMGASLLKAAGLAQFVATSEEQYVRLAVELADQLERLEQLRAGMRERLRDSALLDEAGFTRELERAYRQMWQSWCESGKRSG
jgi:predicted O-linked N-acetylglucosamine transferase (SPINDLY family)